MPVTVEAEKVKIDVWAPGSGFYKKLTEKVISHENSPEHRDNYTQWKKLNKREGTAAVDCLLEREITK